MIGVGWAWVNHNKTTVGVAHPVGVGAGACHHARVGRGEAVYIFKQRNRVIRLPIEVVHDLTIGAGEGQFAVGRFVFHVARFFAG